MKNLLYLLLFSLISSCGLISTFKVRDAFEAESISSTPFREEIPFELRNGLIIIPATIEAITAYFILDTGASVHLDTPLASMVSAQKLGKIKTYDSNDNKQYIPYVKIPELKIGGVKFYDIVASVSDMEHLNTAACLNVMGIIGANAMNKCIWQIDYQRKRIIFTNKRDDIQVSDNAHKINFSAVGKGVPTIPIYATGQYLGEAIFDTGSNGGFSIDQRFLPDSCDARQGQYYNYGSHSSELRNWQLARVPSLQLDKALTLDNPLVTFDENRPFGIIGNKFLRNYVVTFDWGYQRIFLDPQKVQLPETTTSFGFYPRFVEGEVLVGSLLKDSPAHQLGLRLNDKILRMNYIAIEEGLEHSAYCQYLEERDEWTTMDLTIQRGDSTFEFSLHKVDIFR